MTIYVRNSTTAQEVPMGYFVSSTDGNTEVTTITASLAYVWRTGTTSLITVTAGLLHMANGIGYVVLDEAHTGVNGSGAVFAHVTGALPVKTEICVLPQQVYDSMMAGTDVLDVNAFQWAGSATSVSDVAIQDTTDSRFNVNVASWQGTSVSTKNIALRTEISLSVVNVTAWAGTSVTNNSIVMRSTSATLLADVQAWLGTGVATPPAVHATMYGGVSTSASHLAVQDFSTRVNANVQQWAGKSTSTSDLAAFSVSQTVLTSAAGGSVNVGQWAGVTVSASNLALVYFSTRINANVQQWAGKSTSTSDLAAFSVSQTVLTSATIVGAVNVAQWNGVTVSSSNIAIRNTLAKTTHLTGFNDVSQATVSSVLLGTALTESYAADGAAFTLPQALYQIWSRLSEFSISAQVITALQLDGATPAMTFSLDSATAPTKVNRVS